MNLRIFDNARLAAAVIFSMAAATAQAGTPPQSPQTTTVAAFAPPVGYAILQDHDNGQPVYGFSSNRTNWNIAQWGNDADLPAMRQIGVAPSARPIYAAQSPSTHVVVTTGTATAQATMAFDQNGAALPCLNNGQPNEFDLFAQPNGSLNSPSQILATLPPAQQWPLTLSHMTSLDATGTYQTLSAVQVASALKCPINQASSLISVILADTSVSPAQVLFYQLSLTNICPPGVGYSNCSTPRPNFFYANVPMTSNGVVTTSIWGYDDLASSYGIPLIQDLHKHVLALNLLPRLASVLQTSNRQLDPDLSHWQLNCFYLGQHIWGNLRMATQFTGFVPSVTFVPQS